MAKKQPPQEEIVENVEMSIWDHLDEIRKRMFFVLIALIGGTVISFSVTQYFLDLLARPIGGLSKLQTIEVSEQIGVYMRVALLSGLILAMPVVVYELLGFILPGLTRSEKKWINMAVPTASLLFLSGVLFSYFVMLPSAVPFLISFIPGLNANIRLSNYIDFVTNLMFWIGVAFETPLLVFVLAKFKIVNAGMLARQWRIALVIIAVIAAAVTPTVDPVNMSLLMAPLFLLYVLSIFLASVANPAPRKAKTKK